MVTESFVKPFRHNALRAVADAAGNLTITAGGVHGDATDARVLKEALEAAR